MPDDELSELEGEFTLEQQFESHFAGLVMTWVELGIDPDDFLKCALCREFLVDPDNNFEPREHCQNTIYIVRTASNMDYATVLPGQGGFTAANKEAMSIRGRLFGIDIEGKEIRLAFYDLSGLPPGEE